MKYFLVIGIEFKFFQNPADITIHIGDKFIDTFQLDRDFSTVKNQPNIESKWYKQFGVEKWLSRDDGVKDWNKLPVYYKVYEIEDISVQGKLQIKVENSHNDYTNGFMKNSSQIKFPIVSIIEKSLTENRGEKLMERLAKLDDAVDEHRKLLYTTSAPEYRWPTADRFYVQRENEIHEESAFRDNYWWIGGSFTAEFDIKKWQNNKYIGTTSERDWGKDPRNINTYDMFLASGDLLLNIYNEDQRSNN